MRFIYPLILLLTLFNIGCNRAFDNSPQDAEFAEILNVIEHFFVFMEKQDIALGDSLMLDNAVFVAKNIENGLVSRFTKEDHIQNVASTPGIIERIWDVKISHNSTLASVWTEYDFYINDRFSHCGSNLFNLIKVNDEWKIAGAVFTIQRSQCPSI